MARKKTYNVDSIRRAFEATGIWPFNSRKVLSFPSRTITRVPAPPPNPTLLSTPKTGRQASRLAQDTIGLIPSISPRSLRIKRGIEKLVKFGERVDAELDVETYRHQQLRSQIAGKPKKALKDRRVLTRTRVISYKDVVRLREEKEAKDKAREERSRKRTKGKKVVQRAPSPASTEMADWEDVEDEQEDL